MKIRDIVSVIEEFAPLSLQEGYDNSGLIVGRLDDEVHGVLLAVDVTEEVLWINVIGVDDGKINMTVIRNGEKVRLTNVPFAIFILFNFK